LHPTQKQKNYNPDRDPVPFKGLNWDRYHICLPVLHRLPYSFKKQEELDFTKAHHPTENSTGGGWGGKHFLWWENARRAEKLTNDGTMSASCMGRDTKSVLYLSIRDGQQSKPLVLLYLIFNTAHQLLPQCD
jgi:hypothetical protein